MNPGLYLIFGLIAMLVIGITWIATLNIQDSVSYRRGYETGREVGKAEADRKWKARIDEARAGLTYCRQSGAAKEVSHLSHHN